MQRFVLRVLDEEDIDDQMRSVTTEEVREVLFSMNPWTAPRPGGFNG